MREHFPRGSISHYSMRVSITLEVLKVKRQTPLTQENRFKHPEKKIAKLNLVYIKKSHIMIKFSLALASRASLVAQTLKNLPSTQETWIRSLSQEDSLEKEMATHPSILAWRIPWTEEPGGLQSMGLQSWTRATNLFTFTFRKVTTFNIDKYKT